MTHEIEPAETRWGIEQRHPRPSWLSAAGQHDRRGEAEHAIAMRAIGRRIELQAARQFERLAEQLGEMEADARALSEAKWRLVRAKKESEVLAAEDVDLRAAFAILDDDHFQRRRHGLLGGLE